MEEAIESIFAQSFSSWELLLVDDGSTDGSTQLAQDYAARHCDRIFYLCHPGRANLGQSASRNLAMRRARGRYIAPLDADDLWLPRKLEEQVTLLEQHPSAAALFGRTHWWYSWTGHSEDQERDFIPELGVTPDSIVEPPNLLIGCLRETVPVPLLTSMLIRRDAAEQVGGFDESFRKLFEDQAFLSKLFLAFPVFAADECWIRYRRHGNSTCVLARRAGEIDAAAVMYLDWLGDYLGNRGLRGSDAWRALQKRRFRQRHPYLARVGSRLAAIPADLGRRLSPFRSK